MAGGGVSGGTMAYTRIANYSGVAGSIAGGLAGVVRVALLSMAQGGIAGGLADIVGTLGRHTSGVNGADVIMVEGMTAKKITNKFYIKV